jgi:nucleotide-binding universal stress UspA family protein
VEFRRILVYVDGRPACERAVRVAAAIAARSGGKVDLLHVADPLAPPPEVEPSLQEAFVAEQVEELDRLRAVAQGEGVTVGAEVRAGRPFVELIRTALRDGCDLVVKAAKGRGRLGWPLLGSTAHHLVRKCPVPVWLVGPEGEPVPRRILALLASDPLSEERRILDRQVLGVACSLAGATGARLGVGAAWDAPHEHALSRRLPAEAVKRYVEGARRQAEEGLRDALEPFKGLVPADGVHLVRGVPYLELAELAGRQADLVVVGTAPPGAGSGFLIREEAEELINRLDTSIVAVKPEGFVSPVASG